MSCALCQALVMAISILASQRLDVVANLDPSRYVGEWFEIARLPNRFQDKCAGDIVARYAARPGGGFTVVNRCRQLDGTTTEAAGVARTVKGAPSSVLQVRFAPAFLSFLPQVWGDYQVIALDEAHSYALVGTPDRKYLWLLSRTPVMDAALYDRLMAAARTQGFDISRVIKTPQSGASSR
jgi:apolipoprotein D and lipocalin family protein